MERLGRTAECPACAGTGLTHMPECRKRLEGLLAAERAAQQAQAQLAAPAPADPGPSGSQGSNPAGGQAGDVDMSDPSGGVGGTGGGASVVSAEALGKPDEDMSVAGEP